MNFPVVAVVNIPRLPSEKHPDMSAKYTENDKVFYSIMEEGVRVAERIMDMEGSERIHRQTQRNTFLAVGLGALCGWGITFLASNSDRILAFFEKLVDTIG